MIFYLKQNFEEVNSPQMHPLTQLTCGEVPTGDIGQVLSHLADTLDRLIIRGVGLKVGENDSDLSLFGPFIARATIEVALTAIVARFDPFRILAIRKSQSLQVYDPHSRNSISFNWAADVQGDEKAKAWDARPGPKDLQRALLSSHFNDLIWQEAFTKMLDDVDYHRGAAWMTKLKRIDPQGFCTSMRSEGDRLYSELSKGIHHELVIPNVLSFDRVTVVDLLRRTWELIGCIGIAASYSPVAQHKSAASSIELFEEAQRELS